MREAISAKTVTCAKRRAPRSERIGTAIPGALALAILCALALLWSASAQAAPGDLDSSFGNTGTVVTDLGDAPGFADVGLSVAVDAAGRTVVAGAATPDAQSSDFAVARYTADGGLDPTFGDGGRVVTDLSEGNASIKALAIDSSGRILAAGESNDAMGNPAYALARYEPDGTLDATFGGGDGVATIATFANGGITDIALDASGRILVVGPGGAVSEGESAPEFDFVLMRFTEAGVLDASFGGGDGTITTDLGGTHDEARAVAITGSGQILVGGTKGVCCAGSPEIALVRYEASGVLDTTFGGGDGIATTTVANGVTTVDLNLTSDGKVAVAAQGSSLFPGSMDNVTVAQYTAAGSPDPTFGGGDGIVTTTVGSTTSPGGLAVDSSDRIIIAGTTRNSEGEADFALLRYTPTGELDSAFGGGDGITVTDVGSIGDRAGAVTLDGTGRIVVAGSTGNCCGEADDFATARYDSAGSIDSTFGGGDGIALTDFPTDSGDFANDIVLDDQGRAVAVGTTSVGDGQPKLLVARYDTDGQLDTTFGGGDGIVLTDVPDAETERANAVAIDSLGRIVVAGASFTTATTSFDFTLARYDESGSLDPTFGGDGIVTTTFQAFFTDDAAAAVAIDSQGRIVAGGNSEGSFALARYNQDGSLDTSFGGGDGKTTGEVAGNASAMVLEPDDEIVLAGSRNNDQVVARFDASGSVDTGFGSGGVVTTDLGGNDSGDDVVLDGSGRIVVSGRSDADFGLVRLMPDGTPDSSFGGDGIVRTEIVPGGFAEARALAIDSAGRILAAGDVLPNPAEVGLDVVVARYNPSGSLDTTFGGGDGITLTDVGTKDSVRGAALTASDGLVVAGATVPDFGSDLLLARYVGGGPLSTPTWTLDVGTAGEGSGTVTGPGIDCGANCTEAYEEGTAVTLTAVADEGSTFTGWSGDCTGSGACQVTMDAAKEVTANFDPVSEGPPPEESPPPNPPAPLPPPSSSDQPAGPPVPTASLALAARVAPITGGKALLRLRCPGDTVCRGVAGLVARVRLAGRAPRSAKRSRSVLLGQSRFRVPAGRIKVLRIRLNQRGQRLVRRAGHRGLQARLVGRGLQDRAVRLKPGRTKRRNS